MERQQPDHTSNSAPKPPRRPRVRLPFEKRHGDWGEWAYEHRVGLCITLIAYLVLGITFVAGRIVVDARPHAQTIYIDLQMLEMLEQERDKLEAQTKRRNADNADWRSIQNLVSNENATQTGNKGSHGVSDPAGGMDQGLQDRMRANREAYEKGLAEERAILNGKQASQKSDGTNQRVKGRVTVAYSFAEPVRTHRAGRLVIPAYRCEGGGEVVVEAALNPSGDVISARVVSGGDACMRETALAAARDSQFSIDGTAPPKHMGTITYVFIPQ